jgi:hypothetical protein
MTSHRFTTALLSWSLSTFALCATTEARADDATIAACIAANDQGIDLRKRGQLLEARKAFAQCASPACGAEMEEACEKGIAETNELLPAIVFVPKNGVGEDVSGVKLYVDGAAYSDTLDGSAVVVDPGEHEFRFEVSGQQPVTKRFVLREHEQDRREEILIGPRPRPPPAPKTTTSPPPSVIFVNQGQKPVELDSTGSFQRTSGTLLLAVALPVTLVVGLSYGAVAAGKWSSAQTDCKTDCRPGSPAQTELRDARSAATIANIMVPLAGVALVGGIVLRATAPKRRPIAPPSAEIHVMPAINERGAGLFASGSFQ